MKYLLRQPRIDANPEDLMHYEIGVFQVADLAVRHIPESRLAGEVAAKQQSRVYLRLIQVTNQLVS